MISLIWYHLRFTSTRESWRVWQCRPIGCSKRRNMCRDAQENPRSSQFPFFWSQNMVISSRKTMIYGCWIYVGVLRCTSGEPAMYFWRSKTPWVSLVVSVFLSVSCPSVIQNACDFPSITNRLPVDLPHRMGQRNGASLRRWMISHYHPMIVSRVS